MKILRAIFVYLLVLLTLGGVFSLVGIFGVAIHEFSIFSDLFKTGDFGTFARDFGKHYLEFWCGLGIFIIAIACSIGFFLIFSTISNWCWPDEVPDKEPSLRWLSRKVVGAILAIIVFIVTLIIGFAL